MWIYNNNFYDRLSDCLMKLPFKEYTVMSNNLIQKLGCADVYRTYVLLLTADKYTLTTDTTIDQLASFVGDKPANYKGGKSSKSFNDKLRATGEVSIQNKDSGKKDRTWTDYIFFPVSFGHYRRIGREFYDSYNKTLDLKLRGFILKLFSAAEPHSHTITLPVRRMKELIHMGHGTISNYIEQLRDMDLLDEVGDTIILKAKGLLIDLPKDKYVEEVKADFEHMIAFNESRGNPISRECMIYKKYKENNFKGVKDMHALMKSLSSGLVGRKQEAKDKEELPDLIL